MTAWGDPKKLLSESEDPTVRRFLTRGKDRALKAGREDES